MQDIAHKQSTEYYQFLQKFQAKKTTDDCYTPPKIYDVIVQYINEFIIDLSDKDIVRPFYPNGDHQEHAKNYSDNTIVIDNPPFSMLAEIKHFYTERGIKFFLFAPHLTAFSSGLKSYSIIITNISIIYDNGAKVATAFATNLLGDVLIKGCPILAKRLKQAQETDKPKLPKYSYNNNVITACKLGKLVKNGASIEVKRNEGFFIRQLDEQKPHKKQIFGAGFLVTNKVAKSIKQIQDKQLQDKQNQTNCTFWNLSEREKAIIDNMHTI